MQMLTKNYIAECSLNRVGKAVGQTVPRAWAARIFRMSKQMRNRMDRKDILPVKEGEMYPAPKIQELIRSLHAVIANGVTSIKNGNTAT